ncbi:hypothetical protein ANN_18290 [Periplaneta americana]|uniref:Uncharacterized protein n=1 Tax=Periplaneta americana TaxID=6978 RepID=A0ABQ8SNC1_PERAM|nr:hypothetical protein ANN_18290 [Periplaneta americana]
MTTVTREEKHNCSKGKTKHNRCNEKDNHDRGKEKKIYDCSKGKTKHDRCNGKNYGNHEQGEEDSDTQQPQPRQWGDDEDEHGLTNGGSKNNNENSDKTIETTMETVNSWGTKTATITSATIIISTETAAATTTRNFDGKSNYRTPDASSVLETLGWSHATFRYRRKKKHNRGALKYTTEYEEMASLLCFHGYKYVCCYVYVLIVNDEKEGKRMRTYAVTPNILRMRQLHSSLLSESPSFTTIQKNR